MQLLTGFPLADADRCVKCALCLPHCPTYVESRDEGESPRGRIALMQGFATGALEMTPRLTAHLDHCLACRACEAVCPAEVPYGRLIDAARQELLAHGHRESVLARGLAACMRDRSALQALHWLLWLAQRAGLQRVAEILPRLRRLARLLTRLRRPQRRRENHAGMGEDRGEVMLFLGCIARVTEPQVSDAAIAVLTALGFSVRVPAAQGCCSAMDQHAGRAPEAQRLARRNLDAFGDGTAPILHTASGCGATLNEYGLFAGDARAAAFSRRVQDVSGFVARQQALERVRFNAWPVNALVHSPCTLKNVLKTDKPVAELLRRIPGLQASLLPASTACCGAAGTYVINEPVMAERLADRTIALINMQRPDVLVTSNVGCAQHLRAGLARHGLSLPVMHPLEILARQLPAASRDTAV